EQAANVQRGVANHFSIEAESRAASEQAILRIGLEFFWSNARVLAVGGGSDDEANRMFNIPSRLRGTAAVRIQDTIAEFAGEPIEQFRMGGPFALGAEIIGGLDQASAEELLPEPIHFDPGCERVLGTDEPTREIEAIGCSVRAQGRQHGRCAGLDLF